MLYSAIGLNVNRYKIVMVIYPCMSEKLSSCGHLLILLFDGLYIQPALNWQHVPVSRVLYENVDIVQFTMYRLNFSFSEICKTIHFWKV